MDVTITRLSKVKKWDVFTIIDSDDDYVYIDEDYPYANTVIEREPETTFVCVGFSDDYEDYEDCELDDLGGSKRFLYAVDLSTNIRNVLYRHTPRSVMILHRHEGIQNEIHESSSHIDHRSNARSDSHKP